MMEMFTEDEDVDEAEVAGSDDHNGRDVENQEEDQVVEHNRQ